jgi:ATP-dependent Lhr-like helicase
MAFEGLHPRVREACAKRFPSATLVQDKAIPIILSGKHSLVIAPTGIGKTEGALLPLFSKLLELKEKDKRTGIRILYLTPLKALNRDLLERVSWWANELSLKVDVRHGDTTQNQRSKQAKNPPEILISTPETLQSILPAKIMGQHLRLVKWVVVDEVHELVESKRGSQLTLGLERLADKAGEFQRIGLSATVGSPELTAKFLCGARECAIVDASMSRKVRIVVESPNPNTDDKLLTRTLHMLPDAIARLRRLSELVNEHTSVLAFVNTRSTAELLSSRYAAWDTKHKVAVHHSSLAKDVRLVAEQTFKDGTVRGLIATSSLELGIDIGAIDLVVQYMSPRQASRLLQRVGRSGHSILKEPKGIVLAADAEDALESGVVASRALDGKLEEVHVFEHPLDVLAHQLVGLSLDWGRVPVTAALELVRKAYPYRDVTEDVLLRVLRQLASERYIWLDGSSYRAGSGCFQYYFFNVSMIPDEQKYFVKNVVTHSNVGMLDESFVAEHLHPGATFITRGLPWTVLDVGDREVVVEPATDISAGIPDWEGEEIPVPFEVAQRVGEVRRTKDVDSLPLNSDAKGKILKSIERQEKQGFLPSDQGVVIEAFENVCVVHTHWGSRVNETIGKVLSALLTSLTGRAVGMRSDPYRILFQFPSTALPADIARYLKETPSSSLLPILESTVARSSLFKWKFIHVAKRFGLFEKGADYRRIGIGRIISAVVDSPVNEEALAELLADAFDVKRATEVLDRVHSGEIPVEIVERAKAGEFASYARHASDLFLPERAEAEILDLVKTRILEERAGLKCMNCSNLFYRKIRDLPDQITCPKCGGKLITLVDAADKDRVAALINAYGRRAVIVLQARGVGAEFAARILKRLRRSEDELFKDVIDAERDFARTSRYWH